MPLPCSPVSCSEQSHDTTSDDESFTNENDITPKPGPSDPALRTREGLSKPTIGLPVKSWSSGSVDSGSGILKSPGAQRERERSVTFLPQSVPSRENSYTMASGDGGKDRDDIAESSADENTAIFKKSGGVNKRSYGSNSGLNAIGVNGDGEQDREHDETDLLPRNRKSASLRSRGSGSSRNAGPQPVLASAQEEPEEEHEGWFKTLVEKYGSVELENKGSVARDHLALERTFLAWLRTSLSFASIGIAVTQLFRLNTTVSSESTEGTITIAAAPARLRSVGKPLGATFLGISILILLLGFHRYFESQHYVIRGKFPASRGTIVIVSLVATAIIIASFVVVIAIAPQALET